MMIGFTTSNYSHITMTSNLRTVAFVALSAWTCLALQPAEAQLPQYSKLYGQGVNAFFAGNSCRADALLSEALTFNSQDPRVLLPSAQSASPGSRR